VGKMLAHERERRARDWPAPCKQCTCAPPLIEPESYRCIPLGTVSGLLYCGADMEIIIDGHYHNSNLPQAIEAWVVGPDDDWDAARALHAQFLSEYHLTSEQVPFVAFHPERDGSADVFTLAHALA
jgi:hypothetical protein